ncbi:hypothetical protein AXF42_Ash003145 [Apostasia shenzhenica]|uniref:Methyltransferase domain-containing protein n=1 Tax=Apostasia shenzhenica TaxID=1088818 RepID=A0A2I0BFB8_9ASPA|nr:hypothetical protein AXF42_Ash003145 [Apostasia shenzhenica]
MSTVLDDEETICDKKSSIECATRSGSYRDPGYWDKRFATEEHYEWLKDYSHFEHLIRPFLRPSYCILELGCGNSHLSERLHSEGVADITCIDLSSVAVKKMLDRLKAKGLQGIKVIEADMLNLPFNSESFDIVIEKGAMGMRSTVNKKWCIEKFDVPSVSLFQDELEGEDFIFRIAID